MLMISFLALLVFALANGAWMMNRLETMHPAQWQELGRPNFAMSTGLGPRLALVRFVWSQGHRKLGDPALSWCCRLAMVAEPLLVLLLVLLFVALAEPWRDAGHEAEIAQIGTLLQDLRAPRT